MNSPKDNGSEDTEDNNNLHKEERYIVSIIKRYEEFKRQASVSGVPMWVLRYYDGMPESYMDNTGDDKKD